MTILLLLAAAAPAALEVELHGLRNARGLVHACITRDSKHFPDCTGDPQATRLSVPASAGLVRVPGLAPGRYALTFIHDENRNHRLDTMLGIPREGFGFSRNPVVRFGAPRFGQVDIGVGPGFTRLEVRMQYLL